MSERSDMPAVLGHRDLLELKRWNTPSIANGWEQITAHPNNAPVFNREPVTDFMPQMGPMVGRAVTLVIEPGNPAHPGKNPNAWREYRSYVASVPGPKIVVVQDLDSPKCIGSAWGEVNANIHRALGCVGAVVDGCIRDLDEMTNAGFKALARQLCVTHAYAIPVSWGDPVEVFGIRVDPGQLIHADKHGFMAIPGEDEPRLLDAVRFMDSNECATLIPAARNTAGQPISEVLDQIETAADAFGAATREKFGKKGEF